MAKYEYICHVCSASFDVLSPASKIEPVGVIDYNIICEKCGKRGARRQMSTGIMGMDAIQEPWEYDYTHQVKPKYVKDHKGNRSKFDPSIHRRGRKGGG